MAVLVLYSPIILAITVLFRKMPIITVYVTNTLQKRYYSHKCRISTNSPGITEKNSYSVSTANNEDNAHGIDIAAMILLRMHSLETSEICMSR